MLLVKWIQDTFTASKKHEKTCWSKGSKNSPYCGLLRPKVKRKQDFLGHMMIVQTFMKGKKKEGEEWAVESNKEKTLNCVRGGLWPSVHEEHNCFPIGLTDPNKWAVFHRCINFCTGNFELTNSIDTIFTSHQSPICHWWSSFYCPW